MNHQKSLGSRLCSLGLTALVAVGALAAIGLASPARAASDFLLELDGVKGESKAAQEELSAKGMELEQAMAELQAQMDKVEALNAEFVKLGFGIIVVGGADPERVAEMSQQLDGGEQIFTEQIASLLDPAVVAQVTENFARIRKGMQDMSRNAEQWDGLEASLDAMNAAVEEAHNSVDELSKATKTTVSITRGKHIPSATLSVR